MNNEKRLQQLQQEKERIDQEIKRLTHSGRLCDFVSKMPIECIRADRSRMPKYSYERRDVWKHIADISKCIFLRDDHSRNYHFFSMQNRRFKDFTVEEMEAAEELVEVFNKHFKKHNSAVKIGDGNVKVTD